MRKTAIAAITAMIMVLATVATASPAQAHKVRRGVSVEPVNQIFDDAGNSITAKVGWSVLRRTENRLSAYASVRGLNRGGVYTFWWVVLPSGAGHDLSQAYVALGGSRIVGRNGRAGMAMKAKKGAESIDGFWALPFRDLDFDLATADIHIEVAYHGQRDDPDYSSQWKKDFWTGSACPAGDPVYNSIGTTGVLLVFNKNIVDGNPVQPHCPVDFAAEHK